MAAGERDTHPPSAGGLYQKSDDTAATIVAADSIDEKALENNTAMKPLEGAPSSPSSSTSRLEAIKTGEVLPVGKGDMKEVEKQETKFSIHDPRAFPDGGYHAWLCVFGAFFATFCSFGECPSETTERAVDTMLMDG